MKYFNIFSVKLWLKLLLAFSGFLVVFFLVVFPRLGSFLVVEGDMQHADVMVILMGGALERELEAADVYHGGFVTRIVMVEFGSHNQKLLDSFNIDLPRGLETTVSVLSQLGVSHCHIEIIPGEVSSTRGEAVAVLGYLRDHPEINSVIMVSSPFHIRRSLMIFRKELRKLDREVVVIPRPSGYGDYEIKKWYSHRNSSKAVLLEYLKLLNVPFGF